MKVHKILMISIKTLQKKSPVRLIRHHFPEAAITLTVLYLNNCCHNPTQDQLYFSHYEAAAARFFEEVSYLLLLCFHAVSSNK